ncbi:MAG: alanine racemase [Actinobacteria bacterium]|nr:MAG: alanine racemase [Actinomycetota bacterium]
MKSPQHEKSDVRMTQRWAWADINLSALAHNVHVLASESAPSELWAVVKANAYGHGALQCATTALDAGATGLCVALVDEAVALRQAGLSAPILVMSEQPPSMHEEMIKYGLIATLYNQATIKHYADAATQQGVVALVHLKVDTGMHRVGVPEAQAIEMAKQISGEQWLELDGVFTHLATADVVGHEATQRQVHSFERVCSELEQIGILPARVHIANSSAAMNHTVGAGLIKNPPTMSRVGIALYGIAADALTNSFGIATASQLQPVLSLKARVSHVQWLESGQAISYGLHRPLQQRSCIATLPLGYADGVPRGLWRTGEVLIGGKRRVIAGVITMDQMMINCGSEDVQVGSEAVLIGRQGQEEISANDWARQLDTIGYEIVCGISTRVPRNYRR